MSQVYIQYKAIYVSVPNNALVCVYVSVWQHSCDVG